MEDCSDLIKKVFSKALAIDVAGTEISGTMSIRGRANLARIDSTQPSLRPKCATEVNSSLIGTWGKT